MKKIDTTSGRACAWDMAARKLTRDLIADGILDKPIARIPQKLAPDAIMHYKLNGYYFRGGEQWCLTHTEDEPIWVPSFINLGVWQEAVKRFRTHDSLHRNVQTILLPLMPEYVASLSDEELVSLMREQLLERDILNTPVRQIEGNTYYFTEDEIYTLDEGSSRFPHGQGSLKLALFRPLGCQYLNLTVWSRAVVNFIPGMTLSECIQVFLDTNVSKKVPTAYSYIERLIQGIGAPEYERVPENQNEKTFDRIRLQVVLPRYMFQTWDELKAAVQENRLEIDSRVLDKIKNDRQFKKFGIPVNYIKMSDVTLLRDHTLEYIFELKD